MVFSSDATLRDRCVRLIITLALAMLTPTALAQDAFAGRPANANPATPTDGDASIRFNRPKAKRYCITCTVDSGRDTSGGAGTMAPACEQCTGSITDSVPGLSVDAAAGGVAVGLSYLGDLADGTNASLALSMGYGWTHTYEMSLLESGQDMLLLRGDGSISHYDRMPTGGFRAMEDEFGDLTVVAPGEFEYSTTDGTLYVFDLPVLGSWPGVRHLLSRIVDRNGVVTTLHYNPDGQLIRVEDQFGNQLLLEYNANGQLVRISDPLGRSITFVYDSTGAQLRRIVLPDGTLVDYQYNLSRQMIRKTVSEPCPMPAPRETIGSAADVNDDGVIDERDLVLLMEAMKAGRVGADLNRDGALTPSDVSVMLGQWGQPTSRPGQPACPSLERYTITYDASDGRPSQIKDSTGAVLFSASSSNGWKVDHEQSLTSGQMSYEPGTADFVDGNGNVWRYEYDSRGLLTRVEAPLVDGQPAVTQYEYDPGTLQISEMTDPLGRVTSYEYDAHGNRTRIIDPEGNETRFEYTHPTIPGLQTKKIEPDGDTWEWEYDAAGNLTKEVDPLHGPGGPFTTYTYDGLGRMTSTTDRNGHATAYTYDASGRTHTVTVDPGGLSLVTEYEYDTAGRATAEIDPRGIRTEYQYDARDRLVQRTRDPGGLGLTTAYEYDGRGRTTSLTNPRGVETTYEYDARGRVISVTVDPGGLGITTEYAYDGNNNVVTELDPNGNVTTYEYDARSRLVTQVDDANGVGATTRYTYDHADNMTRLTREVDAPDGDHRVTTYEYDPLNRMIAETRDPGGLHLRTEYEYAVPGGGGCGCGEGTPGMSQRHKVADPEGKITYYHYDALDRNIRTVRKVSDTADNLGDADDEIVVYSYDFEHNITEQRTENDPHPDVVVQYQYDAADRMISETIDPAGANLERVTTYDGAANVVSTVEHNGNVVQYQYDAADRLVRAFDSHGDIAEWDYDANGNVLRRRDGVGDGNTATHIYDAADRRTREFDATDQPRDTSYDPNGNALTTIDRNGHVTTMTYDGLNRPIGVTRASGLPEEIGSALEYDDASNLRRIAADNAGGSGPGPQVTTFEYDAGDRRTRVIFADDEDGRPRERVFEYDAVGNMTLRTDQHGDITIYQYDDLHRLVQRSYFLEPSSPTYPPIQGPDAYTYDRASRRLSGHHTDPGPGPDVLVERQYDGAGRLVQFTQDARTLQDSLLVLPGMQRSEMIYPSGRIVRETYDGRNRLTSVTDEPLGASIVQYTYDAVNRMVHRTAGNATETTVIYDSLSRPLQTTHTGPSGTLLDIEYGYDAERNLLHARHHHAPDISELYGYDGADRLVTFERGTLAPSNDSMTMPTGVPGLPQGHEWTIDDAGNWLGLDSIVNSVLSSETRTANKANEYTQVGPDPTAYDDNGALRDDGTHLYDYDAESRFTRVRRKSDGLTISEHFYDAFDRRVRTEVSNSGPLDGVTVFLVDNDRRVRAEYDGGGQLLREYVYGMYVDDVLVMDSNLDADGSAVGPADERLYHHADRHYSVRGLSDDAGDLVEGYTYDAYGRQTVFAPGGNGEIDFGGDDAASVGGASAFGNPYLFTGRRLDAATGLYYYRARHYDTRLGRFMQRDPLEFVGDQLSLYEMVGSNPLRFMDPSGTTGVETAGAILAGVAIGYTVVADAIASSGGDVNWTFDELKGTVFIDDEPVKLKRGWHQYEPQIAFRKQNGFGSDVFEFDFEVSYFYHDDGHVSQVILSKTHVDDSCGWGGAVEAKIQVVEGNRAWKDPASKTDYTTIEAPEKAARKFREFELKVTYTVESLAITRSYLSKWRFTGRGTTSLRQKIWANEIASTWIK